MASKLRSKRPGSGRTPLARLRAICLALPEATEKIAWGEPTWRVRGKLFAQLDDHHHGADHLAVWLPAPLGEQEAMVFTDPVRFFRPPYVGPRGWVGVGSIARPTGRRWRTWSSKPIGRWRRRACCARCRPSRGWGPAGRGAPKNRC